MYIQLRRAAFDCLVDLVGMKYAAGPVEIDQFAREDALPAAVSNTRGKYLVEQEGTRCRDCNAALVASKAGSCKQLSREIEICPLVAEALRPEVVGDAAGSDVREAPIDGLA